MLFAELCYRIFEESTFVIMYKIVLMLTWKIHTSINQSNIICFSKIG